MSNHDYMVIRGTKLAEWANLPNDLKQRFLSTCPRSIRAALAKLDAKGA